MPSKNEIVKGIHAQEKKLKEAKRLLGISREPARFIAEKHAEIATFFGVSLPTIRKWAESGMPGCQGAYDLSDVFHWWKDKGPGRRLTAEEDPLMVDGGDSPGLERYRLAKAALAELDLQERERTLLPRESIRAVLVRWGSILRRVGERFHKTCPEAAGALSDALDECQSVIDNELSDTVSGAAERA